MPKYAFIGALAPLLLLGSPVRADWRTPIGGASPILPPGFTPMGYEVLGPPPTRPMTPIPMPKAIPQPATKADLQPGADAPIVWSLPLVDRPLSQAEKSADIAPELQDAILRIEPIYDPTRLDGPDSVPKRRVFAGTAAMDNVFADRWRRADTDANVNAKVVYLAMAWQMRSMPPCDAFSKSRAHGYGDPALTELSTEDCDVLLRTEARAFDDAPPVPIVAGHIDVPVFAAPMPGARMSSQDFWAAQKARIAAIQARLRQRVQGYAKRTEVGMRQ